MNSLTVRDKSLIKREFNQGGYVLNFNNNTFADFTFDSIGVSIQDKYGLSKGASLECFFNEADDHLAGKLLRDLIQQRKDNALFAGEDIPQNEEKLLDECQKLAERLCSSDAISAQIDLVKQSSFNSSYIEQQVTQMYASIDSNPTDAIGKAKELLESCAKTILKERGIQYSSRADFSELMKTALKELKLDRDSVPNDKKASGTIKNTLSCLSTIINGVNDLRNSYGTGHGKENDYTGLSSRHARLAVGLSSTATTFLWDTHNAMLN